MVVKRTAQSQGTLRGACARASARECVRDREPRRERRRIH